MTLSLRGLTHRYGNEPAVEDVSFAIGSGELVALLGPSGCGKTTIVQAVAGHVRPTGGRIRLRGEDVTDRPPESRRVGIVFQRPTLYPHMTVAENVAYGLAARGMDVDEREVVVSRHLDLIGLADRHEAYPAELSGGQARRVELARALAPEPDLLVLDEPLSALDRALRERLRGEIARIQRETGVTTLFVTHDQEEAMALADRLVVMDDGRVAGIGTPRELYETPPNPFVASFLGRSNQLSATLLEREPPTVAFGGTEVVLEPGADPTETGCLAVHVRPEHLWLGVPWSEVDVTFSGTVRGISDVGRRYDVVVALETAEEIVVEHDGTPPAVDDRVAVGVDREDVVLLQEGEDERGSGQPLSSRTDDDPPPNRIG
ncbi:ABC transporter ATP-binding protein [Natronorarus salvus]|uniref:ABC transporter ATP-binding protein n=1 Tax=Natronorarus salvus TaxID=3117733 RepID=UPI002F261C35